MWKWNEKVKKAFYKFLIVILCALLITIYIGEYMNTYMYTSDFSNNLKKSEKKKNPSSIALFLKVRGGLKPITFAFRHKTEYSLDKLNAGLTF